MLSHGLIHLANIIYLTSYSVKDVRVLRWLTILGIFLLIPYYLCWGMWAAAIWNGVFLGINFYRLATHSRATEKPLQAHEKSSNTVPPGRSPVMSS